MLHIKYLIIINDINSKSDLISIDNICNHNCGCDRNIFEPVCDTTTSITYISPCYAGCKQKESNGTLKVS